MKSVKSEKRSIYETVAELEFIAHSADDIPKLLAEIKELLAKLGMA